MCDWVQNYKTLNRHQLKGIKFHYKRNCKCKVSVCVCAGGGPNVETSEWINQRLVKGQIVLCHLIEDESEGHCFSGGGGGGWFFFFLL